MKRSDRAKQFMMFSALKGFQEELKKAEKNPCRKRELLEDEAEELNRTLASIEPGSIVEAEHYSLGEYLKTSGKVEKIDYTFRTMIIAGREIKFFNIAALKIIL